ncbi:MAG: deoxyribose-phosphate aldolase [Granulosicoccus sp.]|jgi:deoxyribose-phosphate aldolase
MSAKANHRNKRIKQIIELIDLTNLDENCDQAAIEKLCAQSITPMGSVAAVCIWPEFIKDAKQHLGAASAINIATVINFPGGSESQHSCTAQIEKALGDGATEIDYVMPYRQLLNGKITEVELALNSIRACVPASIHLKVILETGELKTAQNIKMASELAIDCGADFIKTSTGKVVTNATPETAAIMLDVIAKKNRDIGFKPAGGIRTVNDAEKYLQLAEDKLGEAWLNAAHFRIGASGLLQDALNLVEPT